jgi:hypothetical protein
MRFFIVIFIGFLILSLSGRNQDADKIAYHYNFISDKNFQVGEELKYVVSYTFINIGEVIIKVLDKKSEDNRHFYHAAAYIDSYSGIPFVDLHHIYETKMNEYSEPVFFKGIVKHDDHTSFTEYYFNYADNEIDVKKGKVEPYELWTDSTASADSVYQDGISILFYARKFSGSGKSVKVPCFVNEEKVYTEINFTKQISPISINAVDYDVAGVKLNGRTDFVSVYGLTGAFEGWFSNDEASVPIIAKMKVIIGNVKLELVEWKRQGWNPPKYIK